MNITEREKYYRGDVKKVYANCDICGEKFEVERTVRKYCKACKKIIKTAPYHWQGVKQAQAIFDKKQAEKNKVIQEKNKKSFCINPNCVWGRTSDNTRVCMFGRCVMGRGIF